MRSLKFLLLTLLIITLLTAILEVSGRRGGRHGGTYRHILRTPRKYKKKHSRKSISGSPMQSLATNMLGASSSLCAKAMKNTKLYPTQHVPNWLSAQLPPGGQYYGNILAIPPGAIYYAHPPTQLSGGNFVFGMISGHILRGNRYDYQRHTEYSSSHLPSKNASTTEMMIITNNGTETINKINDTSHEETYTVSTSHDTEASVIVAPTAPIGGIICIALMFNEPVPDNPSKEIEVERVACYPAQLTPPPHVKCSRRNSTVTASHDDQNMEGCIEVPTTEPLQIAGDIDDV